MSKAAPARAGQTVADAHARDLKELLGELNVEPRRGLSAADAERRLLEYGPNELAQAPGEPLWRRIWNQFNQLVVWILIVAAVIAGGMGEWIDTIVILAIVVLNGALGFFQEERAARSLAALRKMSAPHAKVRRDGEVTDREARELVPGDVIVLEAGDNVPADARLFQAFALRSQEAALTGESTPVDKSAEARLAPDTLLGDRENMVYLGSTVIAGKGEALVVATGMQTELGNIAGMLEGFEREPTPLETRMHELGRVLVVVCLILVVIIFGLQWWRGGDLLEIILLSVSLAVAAVPEGLPGVVTICLALGLQRMVRRNALIRKLPSVETLGSVTTICSDKTGTLTRNQMTVREVVTGTSRYEVTGGGYEPVGEFVRAQSGDPSPIDPRSDSDLRQTLLAGALCNNSALARPGEGHETWQVVGDPTEGALLVLARKAGIDDRREDQRVLHEIPFDPDRKAMSVVLEREGQPLMLTKGAPEVVLSRSSHVLIDGRPEPLTDERRNSFLEINSQMAARALRVLGLAQRANPERDGEGFAERDLVFAGLVGMIDPPRDEVRGAIERCRAAGIRPMMITGDHPATAIAIARELKLAEEGDGVMTGRELEEINREQLANRIPQLAVFARASAAHKMKIVEALRSRDQIVAMTGDGVNDAPAVKAADIGIAMGITGTDVTKEASDMVLIDDNFTSIVNAVAEGRRIFDNIQKVIHYLLSCNAGEVILMFVAALLGWPAPLLAIQILWINLVTDGIPAIALALEPSDPDVMERPPRPKREGVLTRASGLQILLHGCIMAATAIVAFYLAKSDWLGHDIDRARTTTFCVLVFTQLFFSLTCRSARYTLPEIGVFSNPTLFAAILLSGLLQVAVVTLPGVNTIFGAGKLDLPWIFILGLALVPVTIVEVAKIARSLWRRRAG